MRIDCWIFPKPPRLDLLTEYASGQNQGWFSVTNLFFWMTESPCMFFWLCNAYFHLFLKTIRHALEIPAGMAEHVFPSDPSTGGVSVQVQPISMDLIVIITLILVSMLRVSMEGYVWMNMETSAAIVRRTTEVSLPFSIFTVIKTCKSRLSFICSIKQTVKNSGLSKANL